MLKRRIYLLKVLNAGLINHCLRNFPLQFNTMGMVKPEAVDIYQTFRCNLRCKHCQSYKRDTGELNFDQWKTIIERLNAWLGVFRLRICGGEPFLRPDLLDIVGFAHNLGIATIITTNGTSIDGTVADRVIKSGLDFISISLDGIRAETHDFLRGTPGIYSKAIQAIELLKDRLAVQLYTTVTGYNLNELSDLVSFAEKNRIKIFFQGLAPGEEWLWPKDKGKVDHIFKELVKRKRSSRSIMNSVRQLRLIHSHYASPGHYMGYPCQAYKSNFMVRPDGNVQLCDKYGFIGNIAEENPQDMWVGGNAGLIRKEMQGCRRNCSFIGGYYYDTLLEKAGKFKDLFLR